MIGRIVSIVGEPHIVCKELNRILLAQGSRLAGGTSRDLLLCRQLVASIQVSLSDNPSFFRIVLLSLPVMPPHIPMSALSENWSDQSRHCCSTRQSWQIDLAKATFSFDAPLSGKNTSVGVLRQLAFLRHLSSSGSNRICEIGSFRRGSSWFTCRLFRQ